MADDPQPAYFLSQFVCSLTTLPDDVNGDEARAIRRGMGLSQRELALSVGVDASTIHRWEKRRTHSVPRMYALALRALLYERAMAQLEPQRDPKTSSNGS